VLFEKEIQTIFRRVRPGLMGINSNPTRNLSLVLEELKANPKWLVQIQKNALEFLAQQNYVTALTESGLMVGSGFFTEIFRKIEYKFLPKEMDDKDFLAFLGRLFDAIGGAEWMERLDEDQLGELITLLIPEGEELMGQVGPQLFEALEILSLRLAYVGVETEIVLRLKERPELKKAFLNLQRDSHKLLNEDGYKAIPGLYANLERCREAVRYIRSKRDREGISLGLTFKLMRIQELSIRTQRILEVIDGMLGEFQVKPMARLVKETVINETARFELRPFISRHISLLAYQITEHTGRAGEHYITSSRGEYREMFRSASIGGAIVAVIALTKALVSILPLAPIPMATLYGLIYSIGFIIIHSLGGTLASKQPAMTASRIAAALDEAKSSEQAMFNLCEMIVRTIRSQLIALLGNFLIAFPVALAICLPFASLHFPLIPHAKAEHLLADLHPWKSLSLWYAAVAGVCLFLSGIFAGAANNWFIFNHVGKRLESSYMLKKFFPVYRLKKVISVIERNIGFWVGNTSLGFMLAFAGAIGVIFGLPIDIRHVTFSSAQLGLAVAHLPFEVSWSEGLLTAATIFVIGLINLGVSFSLTLYMTMKSRRIRFSQTRELARLCFARFRHRPLDFFFPPSDLTPQLPHHAP
jgi:site-specific recombinase